MPSHLPQGRQIFTLTYLNCCLQAPITRTDTETPSILPLELFCPRALWSLPPLLSLPVQAWKLSIGQPREDTRYLHSQPAAGPVTGGQMASQKRRCWAREGRDWHRDRAGPWHPCWGRGTLLLAKIFPASGYDDHWSSQLGTPVTAPFTAPGVLFVPQGQTRGRMATTGCNKPPLLLLEASFAVPAPVWPLSTPEFANASSSYTPHLKVSSWDPQGHVLEPHRHQCPPRVPMSLMQ